MIDRPSREQLCVAAIVGAVLVTFPFLDPGYRLMSIAITTGITAIALLGLTLQFGQAGIMSVGHAGIMGIGAYTSAILATQLGIGFWGALAPSVLVAAVAAMLVGLPSLRVGGQHYIIITFCFCALLVIALTNGGAFTGSATGLDVGSLGTVFGINLSRTGNTYALVVAFVLVSTALVYAAVNSRLGRTLRAIRENPALARAIGIDVNRYKLAVFFLSGAFAGLAGALQAYQLRHISPPLYGAFPSLYLALMIMLGGARFLWGGLIGAAIVEFLPELGHLDPIDARIAYGVGLILVILLLPGGVSAGLAAGWRRLGLGRDGHAAAAGRPDPVAPVGRR